MRPLVVVESLFVAAFVAVAGWATLRPSGQLPELRAEALASGPSEERWMGIFQGGSHIGYSMSREAPTADGGRVYTEQAVFSLGSMGTVSRVVLGGSAVVGADGALRQVEAFSSSPVVALVRGEVQAEKIHLEVTQGGSTSVIDVPIDEPPKVAATLSTELRGAGLEPGKRITVPYFDPMRQVSTTATLVVESAETLATGEVGYWVRGEFGGMDVRRLVDGETGETIREEGAMGLTLQRMTKEDAMAVDAGPPPDMVALAAVPIEGTIDESNPIHMIAVRVRGVPARKFADSPPLQTVEGDVVRVSVPLLAELPTLPVQGEGDTEATPSVQSTAPEIVERARAVVGDAPDRLEAVRRLHRFVYEYVDKVPTIGVPNGLDVLREKQGDCNEHTALFVSLARAVGIPSRIAAGLVYSSRTGGPPAFYYHAWPEVRLGGPTDWVPVDPTLDQLPADATHLKIVNGDLDRQVEIMGLIGKVGLTLVEAR